MNRLKDIYVTLAIVFLALSSSLPNEKHYIIVAKDGSGDYKTITEALHSLPMFNYERVVIFIKSAVYNEKIRITQDYITLRGENKEWTSIIYSQLRSDWEANKDSIGPAVINIDGDDVILENLTVKNTQTQFGPHAFAVYGKGTRTILLNCYFTSQGGDTVSLWDYKDGMYYHSNCTFVGAVDFVCPRGWCYIADSFFYQEKQTASLWHAGGFNKDQKLVVKNSTFSGVNGFHLGRHHYDAQFFLINCTFSEKMKDTAIYRVTYNDPAKDRAFNWGERYYFFNCHRTGGDFEWFKDNLSSANNIKPEEITSKWTFDAKWDPESKEGPKIIKYNIQNNILLLEFNELLTVEGIPEVKSNNGKILKFVSGNGSNCLKLVSEGNISAEDINGLEIINDSKITGATASVSERIASLKIKF